MITKLLWNVEVQFHCQTISCLKKWCSYDDESKNFQSDASRIKNRKGIFTASGKMQGVIYVIKRLKYPYENLGREVEKAALLARMEYD